MLEVILLGLLMFVIGLILVVNMIDMIIIIDELVVIIELDIMDMIDIIDELVMMASDLLGFGVVFIVIVMLVGIFVV